MKYDFQLVLLLVFLPLLFGSSIVAQESEGLQPGLAMSIFPLSLPIYAEASDQSDQLTAIEPGDMVNILQIDEEWAQIEYDDVVGWATYSVPGLSLFLTNLDSPMPMPRGLHQMTYDVESDRVILFGGIRQHPYWVNDTWVYEVSTNTWTKMAPDQSPPLGEGPLAYDSQSDRAIFFYGADVPLANTASQTWAYDYNTDTWTNMEPASEPPPLLGARIVYDSESDRMILFGGVNPASFVPANETWAYDYDTNAWTKMAPEVSALGLNYQNMAYDSAADRIILIPAFHGVLSDETWVYDYNTNTWEAREATEGPGRREYSAMVYADRIGRLILFGNGDPKSKDDTWSYNFETNTWTELHPDTSPSRRGWHAMAYSSADDLIVLFGGGEIRNDHTLETWLYDPSANTWTQVGP